MDPNANTNNSLVDLNDLTNTTSSSSPSNILWNMNENEETFLQNLFANTLLNDDFSKKPDFDLGLGFDNLQLNYDPINNQTNDQTSSLIQTTDATSVSQQLDSNTTTTTTTSGDQMENNNNKESLTVTTTTVTVTTIDPLLIIQDLKLTQNSTNHNNSLVIEDFITSTDLNLIDLNLTNKSPIIQTTSSNSLTEDDKLFKRPSNDFITTNNLNLKQQKVFKIHKKDDLIVKKSPSEKLKQFKEAKTKDTNTSGKLSATSSNIINENNSNNNNTNQLLAINKLKRSRKRSKLLINSHQTSHQDMCIKTTSKQIKHNLVNRQSSSSNNNNDNNNNNNNGLNTSKLIVKEQFSKTLTATTTNKNKQNFKFNLTNTAANFEPVSKKFAPTLLTPSTGLTNSSTITIIKNNNNSSTAVSSNDAQSSNLTTNQAELEKNIFILNENSNCNLKNFKLITTQSSQSSSSSSSSTNCTNNNNNNNNLLLKRDEVDLHIKELSLLDLHSSEDDSSNDLTKKNSSHLNKIKQQNIRSQSKEPIEIQNNLNLSQQPVQIQIQQTPLNKFTTVHLNNELFLNSLENKNSNLNEIISKRIKYSPINNNNNNNNGTNTPLDDLTQNQKLIKLTNQSDQTENSNSSKNNLDKFIQYFKSLDSSSQEPVIISPKNNTPKDSSKKTLDSLFSPPSPSNHQKTQNKRKKKDIQQQPTTNSQNYTTSNNNTNTKLNQNQMNDQNQIILISLTPDKQNQPIANRMPPAQHHQSLTINLENDTLQHMKNLDINNTTSSTFTHEAPPQSNKNLSLNLKDKNSRSYLWNLLKSNSTQEELMENFGSALHDKISFWDLVQLKLKFSKVNHLKTTYEIIDDYTILYSNMSALLERFVNEQSSFSLITSSNKKGENSSRSRSSSRNYRKQSTSSSNR